MYIIDHASILDTVRSGDARPCVSTTRHGYGTAMKPKDWLHRTMITGGGVRPLQQIRWTGNIRELRNVVARLMILCDGKITGEDMRRYAMF